MGRVSGAAQLEAVGWMSPPYAKAFFPVTTVPSPQDIASQIDARLRSLPLENTPSVRAVRQAFSRTLRNADGHFVFQVASVLRSIYGYRTVPYELIQAHKGAFQLLGKRELEELGKGLDSWFSVDSFARTLSGPAWRDGLIGDDLVEKWARSRDRWWRRAALVSTVALNVRSLGGKGDVSRTLKVCRLLVDDHEDMVEKALSWALRELVVHDASAVTRFIASYENRLGAPVRREVGSKLRTGLKAPRRSRKQGG